MSCCPESVIFKDLAIDRHMGRLMAIYCFTAKKQDGQTMVFPLCDLKAGERAQVVWIISEPAMERRLNRLGFRFGEPVTCIFKSRAAGLSAYRLHKRVVGIRQRTTREILVRKNT